MPPKKKASKRDKGRGGKGAKAATREEEEEYGPSRKESKKQERQKRAALQKERQRRRHGDKQWDDDLGRFQRQLRPQRLYVRDVAGDGNCLFRALSDQLHDSAAQHAQTRADVVAFIDAHRADFEPFVEDDEPFDRYVARMRRAGAWGGHLELQAASLCYRANIYVHQLGLPRWDIVNFSEPGARVLQLSYHDGQHWSSVRAVATATPREQARLAFLDGSSDDGSRSDDGSATEPDVPEASGASGASGGPGAPAPTREETIVMQQTGESDLEAVRRALRACGGDVDGAVTALVAQQAQSELGCDVDWRAPPCAGYAQLASGSEGSDTSAECPMPLAAADVLEGTLLVPPVAHAAGAGSAAAMDAPQVAADGEPTDSERMLMNLTQVSDLALVRTALANAHGDVDGAVDWLILRQAQTTPSAAPSLPPEEPQKPSPEPRRTAPVSQKAAAAAAAELQELEAAVAAGRALSKRQKRRLERARRICAAAPSPPSPPPPSSSSQTFSPPPQQVSSIRI